jgi:hypothetical protein
MGFENDLTPSRKMLEYMRQSVQMKRGSKVEKQSDQTAASMC